MAMLKFNKGELASLKNQAIVEGNVYITTDEHAMYVDVAADKRIRIGQIIEKTSAEWESLAQPYDASAYYYITNLNALVRWNGTKWVQINGTADLRADIDDLKTRMGTAEGNITTHSNKIKTLEETIEGIVSTGGEKNIVNGATAGGAEVTINDKKLVLGKFAAADKATIARADLDANFESTLETMEQNITKNANAVTTLNGEETAAGSVKNIAKGYAEAVGATAATGINEAKAAAKAAQDEADALEGIVGAGIADSTLTAEITAIKGVQETQGTNITGLGNRLTTAEGDIDALEGRMTAAEGKITSNTTLAQKGVDDAAAAKKAADDAQAAANKNADDISTINQSLAGHDNEIANIKKDYETKANVETVRSGLQGQIDDIKEALGTAGDGEDSIVSRVGALETGVQGINDKIGNAEMPNTTISGSINTINANLNDLIGRVGDVTNIMNFRGVSATDPSTGIVTIGETVIEPAVGDVVIYNAKEFVYADDEWHEYGDASGNASAISTLSGRVTTAEGKITALEGTVGDATKGLVKAVADNASNITTLDNTVKAMYTNAQIDALLTWGTF